MNGDSIIRFSLLARCCHGRDFRLSSPRVAQLRGARGRRYSRSRTRRRSGVGRSRRDGVLHRAQFARGAGFRHQAAVRSAADKGLAELVTARGGKGIAVVVDHLDVSQVEKLVAEIRAEQGKLHVLVNDISESAEHEFGKTFWQADLERGFALFRNAIHTHIITSHCAAPLLIETAKNSGRTGLIVEIGDGDTYTYRGNLFFDLIKTTVIRLAFAMAYELRKKNVAAVALTPGFLRSEVMLERFGVSEATWQDAVNKEPDYISSETPLYAGRATVALLTDPALMKKSGRVFSTWGLSDEYTFCDADGRRPHWGRHFVAKYGDHMNPCDEGFYKYWFGGALEAVFPDWPS